MFYTKQACVACGKSPKGHLRSLHRNIGLRAIYKKLLLNLNISLDTIAVKPSYMCVSCIQFAGKVSMIKAQLTETVGASRSPVIPTQVDNLKVL